MHVAIEQEITAPAADVWRVISTPGNLENCHPFCETNPVQDWPGAESRDEVHYLNGLGYERHFHEWHEGVGYDLEIIFKDRVVANVSWRIESIDARICVLRIHVVPKALDRYPVAIRWLPSYLKSVTKGFQWFVERGEPVPRDQFGKHPWFSAMDL